MAEGEDELDEAKPESGGEKKKFIIVGIVAVCLLTGIGGGLFLYMNSNDKTAVVLVDGEVVEADDDSGGFFSSGKKKAIYHKLRPQFITTFEANSRQRYVQMEVTLVTRNEEIVNALITHNPLIRNALVLVMGKQNYLELQTLAGKEKLRQAALTAVRGVLKKETGSGGVEKVLFTNFVMQ